MSVILDYLHVISRVNSGEMNPSMHQIQNDKNTVLHVTFNTIHFAVELFHLSFPNDHL